MRTNFAEREVVIEAGETAVFKLDANHKAFKILFDSLYQDKIQSVTREIWSNALDAHIQKGNPDEPFEVSFPSIFDPTFRVRDFGISLTHDQVMDMYTTAFRSTKEDTDLQVGKLGLGSKSPFAYTDNFTVTVVLDGEKRFYSAMIGDDMMPRIHLMGREESDEDNGVEVAFPVPESDFNAFQYAANRVSLGFDVKPIVSDGNKKFVGWPTLDIVEDNEYFTWISRKYASNTLLPEVAYARMGCVLYPVDLKLLDPEVTKYFTSHSKATFIFKMPIGTIEPSASREGLSYGRMEPTIPAMNAALRSAINNIATPHIEYLADDTKTIWDRFRYVAHLHSTVMSLVGPIDKPFRESLTLDQTALYPNNTGRRAMLLPGHAVESKSFMFRKRNKDVTHMGISGRLIPTASSRSMISLSIDPMTYPLIIIRDRRPGGDHVKSFTDRIKLAVAKRMEEIASWYKEDTVEGYFTLELFVVDYCFSDYRIPYVLQDVFDDPGAICMAQDLPMPPVAKKTSGAPAAPTVAVFRLDRANPDRSASGRFARVDRDTYFKDNPVGIYMNTTFGSYDYSNPGLANDCVVAQALSTYGRFSKLPFVFIDKVSKRSFERQAGWITLQEAVKSITQAEIQASLTPLIADEAKKQVYKEIHGNHFSNSWFRYHSHAKKWDKEFANYKGKFKKWYTFLNQDSARRWNASATNPFVRIGLVPADMKERISLLYTRMLKEFNDVYADLSKINSSYDVDAYIAMIKHIDAAQDLKQKLQATKKNLTSKKKLFTRSKQQTIRSARVKGALLKCA